MTDYICRQDFRKELIDTPFHPRCETTPDLLTSVQDRLNDTLELLDNFPPADVRPMKEGHWISAYDGSVTSLNSNGCPEVSCHCSECGDWLTASDEYYAKGRFCPNCGAKMGGKSDG